MIHMVILIKLLHSYFAVLLNMLSDILPAEYAATFSAFYSTIPSYFQIKHSECASIHFKLSSYCTHQPTTLTEFVCKIYVA